MHAITVRHNFEAAHRLPQLGGKCENLHGHSWCAHITVAGRAPLDESGVLIDFGALKSQLRAWIDETLDHGAMLGKDDPLVEPLSSLGSKLFRFGVDAPAHDLNWPTVESVGIVLLRVGESALKKMNRSDLMVARVRIDETWKNAAEIEARW